MCHCISPQALLSALAGRAAREGYEPTRADFVAVLELGCTREEILAAFGRGGRTMPAGGRATLDALAPSTDGAALHPRAG